MSEGDLSLRQHLLDPAYWRPRLERLAQVPRKLVIVPRPDLSRPGVEVLELRLQAHDRTAVRAILGHSAFARAGDDVRIRPAAQRDPEQLDWTALEEGRTDVSLCFPPGRRLEDRVLDVLRVAQAACSLESIASSRVRLGWGQRSDEDEFVLAGLIRDRGWI
jgi:hypothetical protein